MKKAFKRVSGKTHPLTEKQKQELQRIHDELRKDVSVRVRETSRRIQSELQDRQCEFAEVATALKEARGLSLQDICDKTGITRASLSLLENGHGNRTMTTPRRIARAIGVEILVTVK